MLSYASATIQLLLRRINPYYRIIPVSTNQECTNRSISAGNTVVKCAVHIHIPHAHAQPHAHCTIAHAHPQPHAHTIGYTILTQTHTHVALTEGNTLLSHTHARARTNGYNTLTQTRTHARTEGFPCHPFPLSLVSPCSANAAVSSLCPRPNSGHPSLQLRPAR